MKLRLEFTELALQEAVPFAELCRRFGISRQTGYVWLNRYKQEGEPGLANRSRRAHTSPNRTPQDLQARVLELRARHSAWGGRKISRRLCDQGVGPRVPAPSTVNSILRRHHLISPQASADATPWQRFERDEPNALWQMDYKGHFPTLKEGRCHPLTVLDDHSRFNIVLQACTGENTATVQSHLQQAFLRYGIPRQINTDNGAPWGSPREPGQLTELAIWLIRLGIKLSYSRPYHPQTNGKDERFHRSLKAEVLNGRTFATHTQAQAEFARWRDIYNTERPHEGIGLSTPLTRYRPSPRAFPQPLPEPEYGPDDQIIRVGWHGQFTWQGREMKVSRALQQLDIAVRPNPDNPKLIDFYFYHQRFMQLDLTDPGITR